MIFRSNIQTRKYENVDEVAQDIHRIYDNCELYNEGTSILGKEAKRQRNKFQKYLSNF